MGYWGSWSPENANDEQTVIYAQQCQEFRDAFTGIDHKAWDTKAEIRIGLKAEWNHSTKEYTVPQVKEEEEESMRNSTDFACGCWAVSSLYLRILSLAAINVYIYPISGLSQLQAVNTRKYSKDRPRTLWSHYVGYILVPIILFSAAFITKLNYPKK